jgi:selenoprotein W-related protein
MAEPTSNAAPESIAVPSPPAAQRTPRVEIEYCVGCRWMMRAAWTAQELLTTFESELAEVALVPGRTAGIFQVRLDGEMIFDRKAAGGFPELRALKQIIRDRIAPARDLGHSDLPADQDKEGES